MMLSQCIMVARLFASTKWVLTCNNGLVPWHSLAKAGHICTSEPASRAECGLHDCELWVQGELRALTVGFKEFGEVLNPGDDGERTEQLILKRVRELTTRLDTRANDEIAKLPFRS